MDLPQFLTEYASYFERHAPSQLRPFTQATAEQLDELQKRFSTPLPQLYRDLMMQTNHVLSFTGNFELMSVAETMNSCDMMNGHLTDGTFDDGRIQRHKEQGFGNWDGNYLKEVWWHRQWLPFAKDGCGNMKCIDFAPGKEGSVGQIVAMEIQDGQGPFIETDHGDIEDYLTKNLGYLRDGRVSAFPDGDEYWIEIDHYNGPQPGFWDSLGNG